MVHWTTKISQMVTEMFLGIAQKLCCQIFYCSILSNNQIFWATIFFSIIGSTDIINQRNEKISTTSKTFLHKDQKTFKWHSKNLVIDYGD
jgi:hypothetical protein